MAQLNPIVYIPPTVLVLAIIGILSFRYLDAIQFQWQDLRSRLRSRGAGNGDPGLEEHRGEDEQDELLLDLEYDENGEPILPEEGGGHHQGGGAQVEPQGSATSARLRMHHEMVQQMRARAGFAPEPFPGDVEDGQGEGDGDEDEEDEEGEDDGGAGSSTGVRGTPTTAARIKRIGKKKAERLQRREQMRAYHEFMEMQRAERRQQEEMFKMQDAAQQEERQRKRAEQLEKDRKRKEQLKQKEAKDTESRLKRIQAERLKEEKARRDLRSYIQRVRSFQLSDLAQRLGRTEAQLLKDLAAIAAETDLQASHASPVDISTVPRISLASNMTAPTSSSPTSSSSESSRPHLLVLRDPATDRYLILEQSQLQSFAQVVKEQGRISKKELSTASETIFHLASSSPSPSPSIH